MRIQDSSLAFGYGFLQNNWHGINCKNIIEFSQRNAGIHASEKVLKWNAKWILINRTKFHLIATFRMPRAVTQPNGIEIHLKIPNKNNVINFSVLFRTLTRKSAATRYIRPVAASTPTPCTTTITTTTIPTTAVGATITTMKWRSRTAMPSFRRRPLRTPTPTHRSTARITSRSWSSTRIWRRRRPPWPTSTPRRPCPCPFRCPCRSMARRTRTRARAKERARRRNSRRRSCGCGERNRLRPRRLRPIWTELVSTYRKPNSSTHKGLTVKDGNGCHFPFKY